jgi:hypothetical protein
VARPLCRFVLQASQVAYYKSQQAFLGREKVRRPLRPFRRPCGLRFTYVTSALVKRY